MKTILVPTDFSIPANYAIHYAIGLAKNLILQLFFIMRSFPLKVVFTPYDKL